MSYAYVEIDHQIAYSGAYTLSEHPQEIPAVFPGEGMNHGYHDYMGSSPYAAAGGAVTSSVGAAAGPLLGTEGLALLLGLLPLLKMRRLA
jgi:hypothetical protein